MSIHCIRSYMFVFTASHLCYLVVCRSIHNVYAWRSLSSMFYRRTAYHILCCKAIWSYSSLLVVKFRHPRRAQMISCFWVWNLGSMWGLCYRFEGFILEHLTYILSILAIRDSSLHEHSTGILSFRRLLLASKYHEVALATDMKIQLVPLRSTIFLSLWHSLSKINCLWFWCL